MRAITIDTLIVIDEVGNWGGDVQAFDIANERG
jgi:hypothetical protein